jgi:hypothetical protein
MSFYSEVYQKKLEKFKKNQLSKQEQKLERERVRADRPKVRKKYVLRVKRVKKCKLCKVNPKTKTGVYCAGCAVTVRLQKMALSRAKKEFEPVDFSI